MLNTIIQIILSIFLISIMAFIGYSIYNREFINSISISNTNKKITKIFSGILDYSDNSDIDIETYNKTDFSYLDINPSINQNGGAEYSYNFWLFFRPSKYTGLTEIITQGSTSSAIHISDELTSYRTIPHQSHFAADKKHMQYIVLFYKGESIPIISNIVNEYDCNTTDTIYDYPILVKNPLIKIKNDCTEIIVEFNNINHPDTYNSTGTKTIDCTNESSYNERNHNKFGIKNIDVDKYKEKFNMITVVFQENPKIDNIFNNNKSNCKVYLNGDLKSDKLSNTNSIEDAEIKNFKSRAMRSNLSKLHINPKKINGPISKQKLNDNITEISPLQMADLTYYNYALTTSEIKSLYKNGFNKYNAAIKKKISKSYEKGFNNASYTVEAI
jgi:hypothetical protein